MAHALHGSAIQSVCERTLGDSYFEELKDNHRIEDDLNINFIIFTKRAIVSFSTIYEDASLQLFFSQKHPYNYLITITKP